MRCGWTLFSRKKNYLQAQHAMKVVSNSPGLVDFNIVLVIFVLNFPNGQVKFVKELKITKELLSTLHIIGLVKITFGLVHANYSLP